MRKKHWNLLKFHIFYFPSHAFQVKCTSPCDFLFPLFISNFITLSSKFFQWISLQEIALRVDFKNSGCQHWSQPLESLGNHYRFTRSSKSVPSYFYRYSRAEISYFVVVTSFLNSTAPENLDNRVDPKRDTHGST